MATFSDATSSNGMSNNWVANITYNTTAYAGYTLVEATLSLTVKYGWNFTLNKGYSLSINGSKVTGSGKVISQTNSSGSGVTHTLLTHSVKVYHTSNTTITISGSIDASNIYYNSGGYYIGTYSLSKNITLVPSTTRCTAPTSVNISPFYFENNVTITWSGASGGTNNAITGYNIRVYLANETNTDWVYDTWYNCNGGANSATVVATTSSSGSVTYDFSWIPRGRHTKINIVTIGTQDGYWSNSGGDSNTVIRNPYSACTAPTSFVITQTTTTASISRGSVTYLDLSWSGASGGTNNAINSYLIQYSVCDDNASFYTWTDLQTIATTKTSYSFVKMLSSQMVDGKYIKFRVRTQGTADSSYYSGYTASNSLKPYSSCTNPTSVILQSEKDVNNVTHNNVFHNKITISWSEAVSGINNAIKRYYIEYCTSNNNSDWSSWGYLQSSNLTPVGTSSTTVDVSTKVERGSYIKFRIRTEGEAGSIFYSDYVTSNSMRRNSVPLTPTLTVATPTSLEYSYGDIISLKWDEATDADSNVNDYEISIRYTQNGVWTSWQVLNLTLTTTAFTFSKGYSIYPSILNNEKVQFRIRAKDVFGEYSSYSTPCGDITRYDITGVAIGIDGKWVNCQIYYCQNGSWVEQSVSAGINNTWVDADKGV